VTDYTKLGSVSNETRWWFGKIMAGKAGCFAVLEDTARPFDFAYSGIKPLLAGRWIIAHKGMVFFKQAFFA